MAGDFEGSDSGGDRSSDAAVGESGEDIGGTLCGAVTAVDSGGRNVIESGGRAFAADGVGVELIVLEGDRSS